MTRTTTVGCLGVLWIVLGACGGGSEELGPGHGAGGWGAGTSSGGQGGVGGALGGHGGGTSSGGATGGGGAGGGVPCQPGDTVPCYSGDPATIGVGPCAEGLEQCQDGLLGPCKGEVTPQPESCDNTDDDCNGTTDDAAPLSCGMGACQVIVEACSGGQPNTCTALPPAPTESCDGLDDNCDGQIDEGCGCTDADTQACYSGPGGTAGVGMCVTGTQICTGGNWGSCSGDVTPSAESCNGFDDNCDGQIDEGCSCNDGDTQSCYSGPNGTDGVGPCVTGTQSCTSGAWDGCSGDVTPSTESCDGVDNDCDGSTDEDDPGAGQNCDTGQLGICAPGTTACSGGQLGCVPNATATAELCDGVDNDCDGATDEGNPGGGQSCSTGQQGVCAAGTTSCSGGQIVCNQNVQPSSEICDGLDNDCNGSTDEGDPGGGQGCNTGLLGVCSDGTTSCSGGQIVCNQNVQSSTEICDGLDNDCDGANDDGNPGGGQACSTGLLGVCSGGTTSCSGGQIVCAQNTPSSAEVCDGLDNDCDGGSDEGNPGGGQGCNTGLPGPCAAGTTSCTGGQLVCTQNVQPGTEICDGIDNDCNGSADDGNPGGGQSCNTGLLGLCATGATACSGGQIVCNQTTQPSAEVCDGFDNDCDGIADDGNPGGGQSCSTGQQGVCSPGTTGCSGGQIVCSPNTPPSAEVCDGLDNDCNGSTDDGNPGGGQPCFTGLQGVCSVGASACSGGQIVCNQTTLPTSEQCDGLDNDCDGSIDNGDPGGGASCNTGLMGVCAAGTLHCSGGGLSCQQDIIAGPEICGNALDDNCDGQVDESLDLDGDGWGSCDGDCCDAGSPICGTTPELINPGAFEFVGNGLDDDCDPSTSDTVPAPDCSSVASFTNVTGVDVAKAMDLCQFTTANPPLPQKKWGVISAEQVLANGNTPSGTQLSNMRNWQSAVLTNYGTAVFPKHGATMAGLSSGRMRDQNDPGFVVPQSGTAFGSNSTPPPVYLAAHGGQLPASQSCNGNCPAGNGANDSVNVRLTIRVPTNALSFSYKFKFYSAEFPEWTCTIYNDFYLALLQSGASGIPADTNISFDSVNNPVSVNNGFFDVCAATGCYTCPAGTGELAGTGMQGNVGGGTVWLVTTSPVVPGETMVLELTVFDVSDQVWDSLVLLDNFLWGVNPATVGTTPAG